MKHAQQRRRARGALTALLLAALPVGGLLAPPRAPAAVTAAACVAVHTQVWLGVGGGGGFAGGYVLPLEFTNVGNRACTLYGYPGVSAYRGSLRRVGPPAVRLAGSPTLVSLPPGATAHAALRVADTGAVCGRGALPAAGLRVYAPGQRAARTIPTAIEVCAHRAVLSVGFVRAGVGVPGYVTQ